jgi:metal-sulfur cluster biosynthetic enzyme
MTDDDIRDALRDCYDPDIPLNLVDLGLIDHIELTRDHEAPGTNIPGVPPRYRIALSLTPTTHDEAKIAHLTAQIQNRLAGIESISRSTITLNQAPPWTTQRITPAGRRILNLDNPFSILNNPIAKTNAR